MLFREMTTFVEEVIPSKISLTPICIEVYSKRERISFLRAEFSFRAEPFEKNLGAYGSKQEVLKRCLFSF